MLLHCINIHEHFSLLTPSHFLNISIIMQQFNKIYQKTNIIMYEKMTFYCITAYKLNHNVWHSSISILYNNLKLAVTSMWLPCMHASAVIDCRKYRLSEYSRNYTTRRLLMAMSSHKRHVKITASLYRQDVTLMLNGIKHAGNPVGSLFLK